MASKVERIKMQDKLDKQRSIKWNLELQKINSKVVNEKLVDDEEDIKKEKWQILYETTYGSGDFWTLVKAVFADETKELCVKIVKIKELTGIKGLDESCYNKERLKMLQSLQHKKLICIKQYYVTNAGKVYIFMDMMGHNIFLSNHLKTIPKEKTEMRARMWSKQIADSLSYLHSIGIAFGHNLNIDNILIDLKEDVKLFGLESFHCCYKTNGSKMLCGLNDSQSKYFSPEAFQTKHDEIPYDVFRFGVIVYYLMTNSFPFEQTEDKNKFIQQLSLRSWDNGKITDKLCKDLLSRIFVEDHVMRATIDELIKSEWFQI